MTVRGQLSLLEPATRTATINSPQQNGTVAKSVRLYLNVTAASGSGGLTLQLRGYEKITGNPVVLFADSAAITATGMYVFEIAPAVGAADSHRRVVLSAYLPLVWDVNIVHGDASNYTYSLSGEKTS